jgi:uncharacterized Zn finger protein
MKNSKSEFFKKLTWSDIQTWTGGTITSRGQSYQRSRAVRDLALTPDGGLVAWVQGTERYATRVDIKDEELASDCTCPYDGSCKHAVAVVLDYLEKLKQNLKVSTVSENDERLLLLSGEMDDDLEDAFDSENDYDPEETRSEITVSPRREKTGSVSLHAYLEKQGKDQLITMLETIAERYPSAKVFLFDISSLLSEKLRNWSNLPARRSTASVLNRAGEIPGAEKEKPRNIQKCATDWKCCCPRDMPMK